MQQLRNFLTPRARAAEHRGTTMNTGIVELTGTARTTALVAVTGKGPRATKFGRHVRIDKRELMRWIAEQGKRSQ